jgi:hypothetical protein
MLTYADVCIYIQAAAITCAHSYLNSCDGNASKYNFRYLYMLYICVLILLYMCPHAATNATATRLSTTSGIYICSIYVYMCPHTSIYVSSYCYKCVLILVYMCPQTTMYECVLML